MRRECKKNAREDKCIQGFGGNARRLRHEWQNTIKWLSVALDGVRIANWICLTLILVTINNYGNLTEILRTM
jgi:hypothetical protein